MTVGCFSRFLCCGQPPSPSDNAVEAPVLPPIPVLDPIETPVLGPNETPVLALTAAAQPIPPSSPPRIHIDTAEAKQHIARIERFRILVMGRANAGKTTILQRVCNTTDQPELFNGQGQEVDASVVQGSLMRGRHNIEDELVFASNPGFVFHDSCGFEAGSAEEFEVMKKFVMDRAKTTKLDKRIHAIWFCIPLHDRHRMVTSAEMKFFDDCDTGHVPVIVLLTKADTLNLEAYEEVEEKRENGLSVDDVEQYVTEAQGRLLDSSLLMVKERLNNQRFAPHDYLTLIGMDMEGADSTRLIKCTANALNEEGLQQLLISTQQSNLELCIEFAIMKTLKSCMEKQNSKMGPNALASILAVWFPYKRDETGFARFEQFTFVAPAAKRAAAAEAARQKFAFGAAVAEEAREEAVAVVARAFVDRRMAGFKEEFPVDDQMVPDIQQSLYNLRMPTLSNSKYSLQYTAEHGIGAILVLEYLYFLLQVKDQRNNLQVVLDLSVDEYQTSGTRESVCKLINETFQEHGENVEILCPILLQVAKEKQMSRKFNKQG